MANLAGRMPRETTGTVPVFLTNLSAEDFRPAFNTRSRTASLPANSSAALCTRKLLADLSGNGVRAGAATLLPQSFYARTAAELFHSVDGFDSESLIIFLKQLVMVMREAGMITRTNGYVRAACTAEEADLPLRVFMAFWNYSDWSDLFPSMPDLARELQENRYMMLELIMGYAASFTIETLASDFAISTGARRTSLLILSSFIDYSFCGMLARFALARYADTSESVMLSLTDEGRGCLSLVD